MICEGSTEEAENNNNIYDNLSQVGEYKKEEKELIIFDKHDISKLNSKNILTSKEIKENLSSDYILDIDDYKNTMIGKEYTCE